MITNQASSAYRVVTIGDESVGKTSITNRLMGDEFNPYEPGTIGANYHQYTKKFENSEVIVQIWDTAGQEKFKSLSPIYYHGADAAIAVFSMISSSSFARLGEWIENFHQIAGNDTLVYVVGNKIDLVQEYEVKSSEADEWAKSHNLKFYLTSAKTGDGIQTLFSDLAEDLYKNRKKKQAQINEIEPASQSSSCC